MIYSLSIKLLPLEANNMKKIFSFILICSLFTICLTGCSDSLSRKEYTIATGNKTGVYYPIGEALSMIIKQEQPDVTLKVIETAGSLENIQLIKEGKVDMALIQNDIAYYAANAEAMFSGKEKVESISGMATLFPEIIHFVVRKDSNINNINELTGHKIAVGTQGSGTYYNAMQILSTAGVWESIEKIYQNSTSAMEELATGNIDGFVFTVGLPNESIINLGKKLEIKLLPLEAELIQKLVNNYSFYYPSMISKHQYPGQQEEVSALEINAILVSSNTLNENDQYLLTKMLFGKPNELGKSHPRLAKMTKASLRHQLSVNLGNGAHKAHMELK